jgi:hypothetical protein
VPPRIKVTTLESQLIHLIQELFGRTLRKNLGNLQKNQDRLEPAFKPVIRSAAKHPATR